MTSSWPRPPSSYYITCNTVCELIGATGWRLRAGAILQTVPRPRLATCHVCALHFVWKQSSTSPIGSFSTLLTNCCPASFSFQQNIITLFKTTKKRINCTSVCLILWRKKHWEFFISLKGGLSLFYPPIFVDEFQLRYFDFPKQRVRFVFYFVVLI